MNTLADRINLIRNRHKDGRTIDQLAAIQTMNQLVELVAEMQDTLASVKCDMYDSCPLGDDVCQEVEQAITKADALLTTLKE